MISVVIPTLNAAETLPAALASLAPPGEFVAEIVVSDGGSQDGTAALAARHGCRVVSGERGRGRQLARGAEAATGDWLMFLHADTRLEPGWVPAVREHVETSGAEEKAAVFAFRLDDDGPAARCLERIVAMRVRALALPYGDQGLLISRHLYDSIGGFRPLLLMEDVDIIRRIGRVRLTALPVAAVTSAARYQRDGYLHRMARNATCLAFYFAGVPPTFLARLYG